MAVLGKIRSKGVFLLVIVGIALLCFVVGDALTNSSTWRNKSQSMVINVDGESIDYFQYQALVEQLTEVYKVQNGTSQLSEEMNAQIRSQVLENYIIEKLVLSETKKMGLVVSSDELNDNLIKNVHHIIQRLPIFADENGHFSYTALSNFLQFINNPGNIESAEQQAQLLQWKNYWLFFENLVKINILQDKFKVITSNAVTANSLDAKHNFDLSKSTYTVNYVMQPYFLVPDSAVTVADREIRALYNKRREQYKQEASRTLSYVVFETEPSADDYEAIQRTVDELAAEFATTHDVLTFVKVNSDIPSSEVPYSEKTVPEDLKDFAFSGKAGDFTEPVFANNVHTMARIVETGILRPDSVKLRHIFLNTDNENKADSIMDALRKGADFAAMAQQYSIAQTASKGGEIGWMTEVNGMDKETKAILLKAFDTRVNEIFAEKVPDGVQIMQVLEKTPAIKKVQLAILKIKVEPSGVTVSNIYNIAKQFAAELTGADFHTRAAEKGYQVRTAADLQTTAEKIADITNSRQIIRWAFENKKGKVSDVYECGESFVVVAVTGSAEKGYRPYEELSTQLRTELVYDKKAAKIGSNLSEHLAKNPSLEALGAAVQTEVKTAENVSFSGYMFGGAGYEPRVIGRTIGTEINKISNPIQGSAGVYVVQPISKTDSEFPFNANAQIAQMNQRLTYSLPYSIINNIRSKSKITDNRLRFY